MVRWVRKGAKCAINREMEGCGGMCVAVNLNEEKMKGAIYQRV